MIAQTQSVQNYLKTLHAIGASGKPVKGADVARQLELSNPSIFLMLGRLCKAGLVQKHGRQGYSLTEEGNRQALRVLRKHRILETFLLQILGLDWEAVHEEAEQLEHALSDRVESAMDRALGFPEYDPEGRPIPTADYTIVNRHLTPLPLCPVGQRLVIRELRGGGPDRKRRYQEQGLLPGVSVAIESCDSLDGIFKVRVGDTVFSSSREGLSGVFVEEVPE
jgi:DtxR family Mn-dependent transcriptional regulator